MKLTKSEQELYVILKERNIKVFRLQIKAFETFKKAVEDFIPTIKKYNGKVINTRIITALWNNAQPDNYSFGLTYYMNKPFIKIFVKDKRVNAETTCLSIDFSVYEIELSHDCYNKLNAEKTLNCFNENITYFQKQIKKYQNAVDNYELYFERFKAINDFIEANPIPDILMTPIRIENKFI